MFCFCTFLWLLDLRICFRLKTARPWSEFRINFNQCSMIPFQRKLVEFNNLWIHFIFIQFNCVSMSKTPSPPLQMETSARCLGGRIFCCSKGHCIFFFQFPFWYILEWYKFGLCTTASIRGFGFGLSFTSQRLEES